MKTTIYPCLWFNGNAREAAAFYCTVFRYSVITSDTPQVVTLESSGQKFMFLNGGPHFNFNPFVSFFVLCETVEEVDHLWNKLLADGSVLMPVGTYAWSERYGWLQDRYGINWQLSFGSMKDVGQKFTPALMFANKQHGKAEEAVRFYTSVFDNSEIVGIMKYAGEDNEVEGTVKHAQFHLGGNLFMAMDSSQPHPFNFNEALSFVVECETQQEIDYFWHKLTEGGEESQCGWLKDRYGLSWQIVPAILSTLMADPLRSERVIRAFLQMKKFEIEKLLSA